MAKNNKSSSEQKKFIVSSILKEGKVATIFFDPRDENVIAPQILKEKTKTALEFGLDMPVPITEFEINEIGIGGTLSFNRVKNYCWVPWDKVFCVIISGTSIGSEWVEDIPEDDDTLNKAVSNFKANKNRKTFQVIRGEKIDDNIENKSRAHLKLVK